MKDIFEHILLTLFSLAAIFVFTWIIFWVYFELPMYNVCYWYMIAVVGIMVWGQVSGK